MLMLVLFSEYIENRVSCPNGKYDIFEMAAAQRRHVARERNEIGLNNFVDSLRSSLCSNSRFKSIRS